MMPPYEQWNRLSLFGFNAANKRAGTMTNPDFLKLTAGGKNAMDKGPWNCGGSCRTHLLGYIPRVGAGLRLY